MGDLFSVVQFFANDTYEEVMHDVPVADAIACANHLATSVGAKIGTTRRVIITDADDYPENVCWDCGSKDPEALDRGFRRYVLGEGDDRKH